MRGTGEGGGAAEGRWSRSVVAFLIGSSTNFASTQLASTALGLHVYDLTGRELDLGLLGLAQFAPAALLVLTTGPVADRHDRATICSLASAAQAGVAAGLAIYAATRPTSALPIFGLVLLFGVARAFLGTAQRPLPVDIVEADAVPWLISRRGVFGQIAAIGGPLIAGVLYAIDPVLPYVALGVLGIVAAVAMAVVAQERRAQRPAAPDLAPAEPGSRLHEALEGLRFIGRTPVLFSVILLDLLAVLFGGAVVLLPALAEDELGVGPAGLGILRSAGGAGAAMMTVVIAWRPVTRRVGPVLLAAVGLFGVATIVLGTTTSFVLAVAMMVVVQAADAMSVYIRSTLVPLATPTDKRGRVSAVESVFIGASNELGAFESGVTGAWLGSAGAVRLGGVASVLIAVTFWWRAPSLRRLDRFPRPMGEPAGPEQAEELVASDGEDAPRLPRLN